jgi:hypothetical protein
MRRDVTIGFSEEEILRLQGAAAMARVPLSTYLRWLIRGKADDTLGQTISAILARWRRSGCRPGKPSFPGSKPAECLRA